jgi:AcrR family transcriptional regulator
MDPLRPERTERTEGLTPKATQTRQRILDAALSLFATKGYEGTTMRDIAVAADCSLGLAYRYFASKEEMVLELYWHLARELEAQVGALPAAPIAGRFRQVMRSLLAMMAPHRETLGALFGAALNPRSRVGVFGASVADVRRQSHSVYVTVVAGASDAPRPTQIDNLATVLYGAQLALVLFWLQDLSEGSRKTYEMLDFVHDMLALARPLLRLPPISNALVRLAGIIGPMLGADVDAG